MRKPPAPPRVSEIALLGEAAFVEGVKAPELEEEAEVPDTEVLVSEVLDPEELVPEAPDTEELELREGDGVLALPFTSNLTPVISLPV